MFLVASISGQLSAAEKAITVGGVNLTLEDVSADIEVRYRSMRLNRAQNVWNVEATLTNKSSRVIQGPFVLLVESFTGTTGPQQTDGSDDSTPAKALYDFSASVGDGALSPGEITPERTLTLGVGTGAPNLVTKIFAAPNRGGVALGLVRSLNEVGQPLTGVQIEEVGPVGPTNITTDPVFGVATVGQGIGTHTWKFSAPGYLPVWRQQSLSTGEVAIIASPRLTRRGTNAATITLLDGGQTRDASGAIQISFVAGAVTQNTAATLTPLTGQTLPALLPLGWSPLQAFWLDLSGPVSTPATASLKPSGPISSGETAAFVRLNENTLQWEVVQLLAGNGTNALTATLNGGGAYALVVGDAAPQAPPLAQNGQPLLPSAAPAPNPSVLTAGGTVDPSSSPASRTPELVTATASVTITNPAGPLPSGLVLRCEVLENYRLSDRTGRHPPQYEHFVIGYQRPGDASASTLQASFPLRPIFLFGSEELDEASVKVDVLTPTPFNGSVLDARGGQVAADGLRVLAGSGDVVGQQAAQSRRLNPTNFLDLVPTNVTVVAAFDLTVSGVAADRRLVAQITGAPTNSLFVLARVLYDQGQYGLQPLERLNADGLGRLSSAEPVSGDRLDGLTGAGQYLLVKVDSRQALVTGFARNSGGQPTGGMPVRITGQPWLAFSRADGSFKLLAPTGNVDVAVTDPATGDTGRSTLVVTDPNATANTSLASAAAGPRVVSINPTNGAVNVSRVTPIEIAFSEPVNPATLLGSAIQLLGTNGQPVGASLTLNLRNTIATLLATDPLESGARYTVLISTNIADLTGLRLEGQNQFVFETQKQTARGDLAKLTIFEPGATNIPPNILSQLVAFDPVTNKDSVVAFGSPGTAEAEVAVILVNETSGQTSTVLSKPDGSFAGFLRASAEDLIIAVFVNANGTRATVPAARQQFDDGRVGLYQQGGILEAQSDGGPIQVIVEPNAIRTRNTFKIENLGLTDLLQAVKNTPPEDAKLLGGFRVEIGGDSVSEKAEANVSIPFEPATLNLPPDQKPEDGAFALAIVREIDGQTVYQVVDKLRYRDGRLESNTLPFLGLLAVLLAKEAAAFAAQEAVIGAAAATLTYIFVGNQQIVITGETKQLVQIRNLANPSIPATLAKPLPGAFITARPPNLTVGRPGRLGAGTLFSTSGSDGVYALVVARKTFELATQFKTYVVTASHPAFDDTPSNPLNTSFGVAAQEFDFIFTRRNNGGGPTGKPRIIPSVTPRYPKLNEPTRLKVTAQHLMVAPELFVSIVATSVVSLVPGVTVGPQDIKLENVDETVIGRKRVKRFDVTATKALEARIRISALAAFGDTAFSADAFELIRFGVGAPVVPNALAPADPNDVTGPTVVGTYPVANGLLAPADRIAIAFNEPIDKAVLDDPTAASLGSTGNNKPGLVLSDDQQTLFVTPGILAEGLTHTLTLSSMVKDLKGNPLNRTATEPAGASFSFPFRVAPVLKRDLPDIQFGGGALVHNGHVFALERSGPEGAGQLVVYRLNNIISATGALSPVVARHSISAGFPRDLTLIPQYSFKRKKDAPVETKDLLAVVGGTVAFGGENEKDVIPIGQVLRVFDISNPANPQILFGARLTLRPNVVSAVRWAPPHLVYLENGVDLQQVAVIDLQEAIVGFLATKAEAAAFPLGGVKGKDNNNDGDYVDEGDQFPTPEETPAEFFGFKLGMPVEKTTQQIQDFDYLAPFELCAVVLNKGKARNAIGQPIGADLPPQLQVLFSGGASVTPGAGVLTFDLESRPQRIFFLPATKMLFNGALQDFDLALVSLAPDKDGKNKLAVCDVSFPLNPSLLGSVPLPDNFGVPKSVTLRPDGLLALATSDHLVLLDPLRLALPAPTNEGLHPAIVNVIAGAGSANRSLLQTSYGIGAVNLGGRSEVIISAPRLRFVHFPASSGVVQPRQLVDNEEALKTEFGFLRNPETLQLARVKTVGGAVSSLTPPTPVAHYHVLLEAPGELGGEIFIALESLNESGKPLKNLGALFPPVRAMTEFGVNGIGQKPRQNIDAPIGSLKALRLSSDFKSPFYNVFLSRPFVLITEKIRASDLDSLKLQVDREILWSGPLLRATIDPQDASNPVVGDFASVFDNSGQQLKPGVSALAVTLAGHYLFGPNPPPVGGELSVPATFGTVNASNGEFRHSTVDIELPSPRMPIIISRSYGGQDLFDGPFGRGWDFNYNQRMIEYRPENFPEGSKKPLVIRAAESRNSTVQAGDLVFSSGEARIILFKKLTNAPPKELTDDPLLRDELKWFDPANSAANYYLPGPNDKGVFDVVCRFPSGEFCRVTPDGMQYWYAKSGRLERIHDKYPKNKHVLRYNSDGQLVKIIDESVSADRFLEIGYYRRGDDPLFDSKVDLEPQPASENIIGKIAKLKDYTDTEDREVIFEYAERGTLEKRKGIKASGANGGFNDRPTTSYTWDSTGSHLVGVVAGNGANGGAANSSTALFSATTQVNEEAAPVATGGTGAGGSVQLNIPSSSEQNSAATVDQIQSKTTGPDGGKVDFQFDANGYPKTISMSKPGDLSGEAKYDPRYDDFGRLESITYPEGNSVTYHYFANPPTFRSRPNIQSITVEPGPRGGATLTTSFNGGYDLKYNLPTGDSTDFNNKTITYSLTSDKRDIQSIQYGGVGTHTFSSYNENGQVELETTPEGVQIDPAYAADTGFLTEIKRGGLSTKYDYSAVGGFDKAGDLGGPTHITLPRAQSAGIDIEYDARLQKTKLTRGGRVEDYGYDENGNLTYFRRDLDAGQSYEESRLYNQINFLKELTIKNVEVDGQGQNLTTQFTPDAASRVKEIHYHDNKVRSFQYNHLGHVTRMSIGSTPDADDYHETYGRDRHGNLRSVSTRGDLVRTLDYDGHDRLILIKNKVGGSDEETTEMTYFGGGQRELLKISKGGTEIVLEQQVMDVDELGRPTSEELRGDGVSGTRGYGYQLQGGGLVTTITGPRDTVEITTDAAGRTTKVKNGLTTVRYTPNESGDVEHLESEESGVTYTRDFSYDNLDYLLSESDPVGVHFKYTPRLDGLVKELRDGRGGTPTSSAYTVLEELKTLTRPHGIEFRYEFDAERLNRKVSDKQPAGNEMIYDDQLRLATLKYRNGQSASMSAFDKRNNPQNISLPGSGNIDRTDGYDFQSRIVKQSTSFSGHDYKTENTVYDALGRVRKIDFGSRAQHSAVLTYNKLGPLTHATYSCYELF